MSGTWTVEVPGAFRSDVAFVDLETRKVPCDFRMANGELLRRRWSAFLAGVARDGRVTLVERSGSEEGFLTGVREAIGPKSRVVYMAYREFDEMILRGRFTNARRAHAPAPFYPAMPGAEDLTWEEKRATRYPRGADCESRVVPVIYETDPERVAIHLLRDIAELILFYGEPDAECAAWCELILAGYREAWDAIYGGEPELAR